MRFFLVLSACLIAAVIASAIFLGVWQTTSTGGLESTHGEQTLNDLESESAPSIPSQPGGRARSVSNGLGLAPHSIHGRIVLVSGQSLPSGTAWARFRNDDGQVVQASVASDGHYVVESLSPGRWFAHVGAPGYRTSQAEFELNDAQPDLKRDFFLAASIRIEVLVIDENGRPFVQAARAHGLSELTSHLVPVASLRPPPEFAVDVTRWSLRESRGRFVSRNRVSHELTPSALGVLETEEEGLMYVSLLLNGVLLDIRRQEKPGAQVTFQLETSTLRSMLGEIRLRPVDSLSGHPIPVPVVSLDGRTAAPNDLAAESSQVVLIEDCVPGGHTLSVRASGYLEHVVEISIEVAQILDLGDVSLEKEGDR